MMEEEADVDNTSFGEQEEICQVLFNIVEDQSEVHRRAVKETAISDHPQSNQLRLGKSDGEPGTHITTNISDRQSQMAEGNLSLNSANLLRGNPLHNVYCCSKCKPMDESGIWLILTDKLQYVIAEVDSSVIYSFDQKRYQNSNSKYSDVRPVAKDFLNISTDDNASVKKGYNSKKENFDAANYNLPNVPIYSQQLFPDFVEDRYGDLSLFTTSYFKPHENICATYLWVEKNNCVIMEVEAYDLEGNNMWFKQERFPINLHGETQGEVMDGSGIKATTLMDTGCSKPILNKKFYNKHPYLDQFPHYPLQAIGVVVANDRFIKVTEAIQFMVKFHGHVFEFIAYLADMSESFDLVIGQKSMYELEASVDFNNLAFLFLKRSLPVYATDYYNIRPGKTKDILMELKDVPFKVTGYKDFPETGVATVAKLKSAKDDQLVQTIILHLNHDGKTTIQLTNHSNTDWKIEKGELLGCLDMRSSGYFHVSRGTLQQIMKSLFKDHCSFLSEDKTSGYFDLYNKDHKEVVNHVKTEMNRRLQQQGNTKLVDRNEPPVENDTDIVPDM